ncbi:MAG: hypothetical protein ACKV2V_04140 [Blastocatellia bacterium]
MKKTILCVSMLMVLSMMAAVTSARTRYSSRLTINIPFGFTVNNTEMPAGKYEILLGENGSANQLCVSSADKRKAVIVFSTLKETRNDNTNSKLVFRRYGNQYFLGEVWSKFETNGFELTPSGAEKKARRQMREDRLASNATSVEIAMVTVLTEQQ